MENFPGLNWIDAVLIAVLGWAAVSGLLRGLVRGVFGVLSLIFGFFAARQYGWRCGEAVGLIIGKSVFSAALGYVLVFVLAVLAFSGAAYLARKAVDIADLGGTDKFGGLLFGAANGGILGALCVVILSALPLQNAAAWRESFMVPVFGGVIKAAFYIPGLGEYREYVSFDSERRPHLELAFGGAQGAEKENGANENGAAQTAAGANENNTNNENNADNAENENNAGGENIAGQNGAENNAALGETSSDNAGGETTQETNAGINGAAQNEVNGANANSDEKHDTTRDENGENNLNQNDKEADG